MAATKRVDMDRGRYLLCFCLFVLIPSVSAMDCKQNEYYDTVVSSCTPCDKICDPKHGTTNQCIRESACSGILKASLRKYYQAADSDPDEDTPANTTGRPVVVLAVTAVEGSRWGSLGMGVVIGAGVTLTLVGAVILIVHFRRRRQRANTRGPIHQEEGREESQTPATIGPGENAGLMGGGPELNRA